MKTPVIDGLYMAANDGVYPELERIAGRNGYELSTELEELEKLLAPLPLGQRTKGKILDLGTDLFAVGAEAGFRRGCRVGAQLIAELQGAPEAPETGGGV